MKAFIWKLRCAICYMRRTHVGIRTAWELADTPTAQERQDYGPEEYAEGDIEYWAD